MTPLLGTLGFALLPAAAVVTGGIASLTRRPGQGMRSSIQHFAAGLLFAAIATELLPEVLHERSPVAALTGFALGVALMLGVKWLIERSGQRGVGEVEQPTSLLVTLGVDITVDGLLIGVGFAAGARQGFLLTVALAVEALFLGLSGSAALTKAGATRARILATTAVLAFLSFAGVVVGLWLLRGLSGAAHEVVLSFGSAALLYLVTEELLVEAHEEPHTPLRAAMFFVGFGALFLVEMMSQPQAVIR